MGRSRWSCSLPGMLFSAGDEPSSIELNHQQVCPVFLLPLHLCQDWACFLKYWFKQGAKMATPLSLLEAFCLDSTLLYILGIIFFPFQNTFISSAFLCSAVACLCFPQLSIANQSWLFWKLSLLKWQQQPELSAWTSLYGGRTEKIVLSLKFIQANPSSVYLCWLF